MTNFPRIIGREFKKKRSKRTMAIITAFIIAGALLLIAALKAHDQKVEDRAKRAERAYIMAHWDKVVNGEIRYRANKEISEGVK